MTATSTPRHPFFVTVPVADVQRSKAFFTRLGFGVDPAMDGDGSACLSVGEGTHVMLLSRERFADFSHVPVGDPRTHALALFSFSVGTREEVDSVAAEAVAAGGREADGLEDLGFMVTRSFFDLDGHGWQVMWTNPSS